MTPSSKLLSRAANAALGLAAIVLAGTASGAAFQQHLDPTYWSGDGLFEVDNCGPTSSSLQFAMVGTNGCTVSILSIVLNGQGGANGTIRFTPPTITTTAQNQNGINSVLWNNNQLVGFQSDPLTSVYSDGYFANHTYTLVYNAAIIQTGYIATASLSCSDDDRYHDKSVVKHGTYTLPSPPSDPCSGITVGGLARQEIAIRVPEPGSVSLLFAAFGTAWWSRRKKRQA